MSKKEGSKKTLVEIIEHYQRNISSPYLDCDGEFYVNKKTDVIIEDVSWIEHYEIKDFEKKVIAKFLDYSPERIIKVRDHVDPSNRAGWVIKEDDEIVKVGEDIEHKHLITIGIKWEWREEDDTLLKKINGHYAPFGGTSQPLLIRRIKIKNDSKGGN